MSSLPSPSPPGEPSPSQADSFERALAAERRFRAEETPDWPPWMAPAALIGALVLAAVGGLIVDLPAAAFGVSITSSHIPGGLEIADTVVQDVVFILTPSCSRGWAVARCAPGSSGCARRGCGWLWTVLLPLGLFVAFLIFSVIWAGILDESDKEKILEQLGANEGTSLLLLSAALTCVIAPICEEFLFQGLHLHGAAQLAGTWPAAIITGLLFGGVHVGSAPAVDLVPLAFARLWAVPALPLSRLAVSVYRRALAEQLARVRQPRELGVRQVIALIAGSLAADRRDRAGGQTRRPDHARAHARLAGGSACRRERRGGRAGSSPRAHRICAVLAPASPPAPGGHCPPSPGR